MRPSVEPSRCGARLRVLAISFVILAMGWQPALADRDAAKTAIKLGNDRFFQHDFQGAEDHFTTAAGEDPGWAVPYNNRGLVRYKLERLADAETDFTAAAARDAGYLAPLINRAKCRAAQRRWDDALADLQAGLVLSPGHPKVLYNLAWVHDARGEAALAAETYETLLTHDPDHIRARIALGIVYAGMGRTGDALDMFYEAVNRAAPGDAGILLAAHNLHLLRGPGLSFATQAAADAHVEGVFHLSTGQHTACRTALADALAQDRRSGETYWVRYLSDLASGRESLARVSLSQAGTRLERRYVADYAGGAEIYHHGHARGTTPAMVYLFPGPSDLVLRRLIDGDRHEWAGPLASAGNAGALVPLRLNPVEADAFDPLGPVADADGDRLADEWEENWFTDLSQGPDGDATDGDGLPQIDEFRAGTRPDATDTDGDGRSDPLEAADGTDPARANAVYYVNDTDTGGDVYCTAPGDNTNDGLTPATPKATLNALLAAVDLTPGAVVRVDAGTYASTVDQVVTADDSGTAILPVAITGAPWGATVLQRTQAPEGGAVLRLDHADHLEVTDLVLTGADTGYGLLNTGGQGIRVNRCTARGNGVGFRINGRIVNSLAHDNDTGIDAGPSAQVVNCTVTQNRGAGIFARGGRIANTIVTATGPGATALYHAEGDLRSDYNLLFADAGAALGFSLGRRDTLDQWQAAAGQDLHSLTADPLFADPAQADFALQSAGGRYDAAAGTWVADTATSPAVDAGSMDTDGSREPSPNGGRTNLGALGNTARASRSAPGRHLRLLSAAGGTRHGNTVPIRFLCTGTGWTDGDTITVNHAVADTPDAWTPVVQDLPHSLSAYLWEAPESVASTGGGTVIRVSWTQDPSLTDTAGRPFYFRGLELTAPEAGKQVSGSLVVTWRTTGSGWGAEDTLRLEHSKDNGSTWTTAAEHLPASAGTYLWDATGAGDGPYHRLRLVSEQIPDLWTGGPGRFYVRNAPLHYYVNDAGTGLDAWSTAPGENLAGNGAGPDRPAASVNWIVDTFDLEPGDTVHIDTGTYAVAENIVVTAADGGADGAPVRFEGSPYGVILDRANLNAGNAVWRIDHAPHVTITTAASDTHPQAARTWMAVTGAHTGIDLSVANHCTLSRLALYGNAHAGIAGNSTLYLACRNNVLHHNDRGIYLWACRGNTLENNTVYDNTTNQIDLEQYSLANTLRNNIVVASGDGAVGIRVHDKARDLHFSDYNLIHIRQGAIAGHYSGDCATLQAWQTATGKDAHSLSNAPGFVDPADGDGHLTSTGGSYHDGRWTPDDTTAAGLDAGDPAQGVGGETGDHGDRINLGAYGGTDQASRTPADRALVLAAPNGGETVKDAYTVRWMTTGRGWTGSDTVTVEVSGDGGTTWQTVAAGVAASQEETVWDSSTGASGATYLLRITCDQQPGLTAASQQWFAVANSRIVYYVNDGATENDRWCTAAGEDALQRGTSADTPAASVSWILDHFDLEPGDVVRVDTGQYSLSENITITSADEGDADAPVTFETSPYGVTLDRGNRSGGNYAWAIDTADHIVIRTATEGADPGRPQRWMRLVNTHIGVNVGYSENCTVEKIEVVDPGKTSVNLFRSHGNRVRNCLVYGADDYGINLWDATGNRIDGNTVAGSYYGGVMFYGSSAANEFFNNVIHQTGTNRPGLDVRSQQAISAADYNLVYTEGGAIHGFFGVNESCNTLQDWQAKSSLDTHSLALDPHFADPGADDYHLMSTGGRYADGTWVIDALSSPAVDAADPDENPADEPPANGGRLNMGAYGGSVLAAKSPDGRQISLRMPRGGEVIQADHPIAWLSPGQGWQDGDTVTIDYSTDDGATWQTVAAAVPARAETGDMAFRWDTAALPDRPFYRVRITCDQDPSVSDASAEWFTIHNGPIVYYVNDNVSGDDVWCTAPGNAANDGLTPDHPLDGIQTVIDRYRLAPGDTVRIDSGSYDLAANILVTAADEGADGAPVTFAASPFGVTVQRSGSGGGRLAWHVEAADHVAVATDTAASGGAAWTPMTITGAEIGIFFNNADNGAVSFIEFTGNVTGISSQSSDAISMAHNLIHGNTTGIHINGSAGNVIVNNTVAANSAVQVNFYSSSGAVMENNIMAAEDAGSAVLNWSFGYAALERSDFNLYHTAGGAILATHRDTNRETLTDWQTATGLDAHSISANPLFVDTATGDFHLESRRGSYHNGAWTADAATSPAVDQGRPDTGCQAEPLQNGGRVNLGAYGGTGQASRSIMSKALSADITNVSSVTLSGTRVTGVTLTVTTDTAAAVGEVAYPGEDTWQVVISGLAETANTITIHGVDGAGDDATAIVTVVYDITPPSVGVDEVDAYTNAATRSVTGTREAGASVSVAGETPGVSAAVDYPTETTWQAAVAGYGRGRTPLTVTAADAAGNTAQVDAFIVYDTQPPAVAIDPVASPTMDATQVLTGTREAEAVISLWVDTTAQIQMVTYPSAETWSATLTQLADGYNRVTVSAVDRAGNIAAADGRILYGTHFYCYGDIDRNDAVDLTDVVLALKICGAMTVETPVFLEGDADEDGTIGLQDALYILGIVGYHRICRLHE